jgi:GAF domain-containing protein
MSGRIDRSSGDRPYTRFWQKISLVAEVSSLCRQLAPDGSTYVRVLKLIQAIVPFDAAMLYLLNPEHTRLEPQACLGEDVRLPSFLARRSDHPTVPWRLRSHKPILLSRTEDDDDFDPDTPFATIMTVPLLIDDQVIGVLNLATYADGLLLNRHVKLMTLVADQLAVAIERDNYVKTIEDQHEAIRQAHAELVTAQKHIIATEKLTAVAELSASINHEINNPLAVIVGHVQCLALDMPDAPAKTKERLDRIEQAALRIGEVNRKLLRIDKLVSEAYLKGDQSRMLNLEKSTSV